MDKKEFRGKTLDEALANAAKAFGVPQTSVGYRILPPEGGLLTRLFARSVRVEAWPEEHIDLQEAAREAVRDIMKRKSTDRTDRRPEKERPAAPEKREAAPNPPKPRRQQQQAPRQQQQNPRQQPAPLQAVPATPATPLSNPEVTALLNDFTEKVLASFGMTPDTFQLRLDEAGDCIITIDDAFVEETLSKSEKLSSALEHVFKRIAHRRFGEVSGRVIFTAGSAQQMREEALKALAHSYAERVKSSGKSVSIPSKTPQERRLIHMALDRYPGIATRSSGTGEKRRLIIYPVEDKRAPRQQRSGGESATAAQPGQPSPNKRRQTNRRKKNRRKTGTENAEVRTAPVKEDDASSLS